MNTIASVKSLVAKVVSYFEGPSRLASAVRHASVTAVVTFGIFVLPVAQNIGEGKPVSVNDAKAVVLAGVAAAAAAAVRTLVPALRKALGL